MTAPEQWEPRPYHFVGDSCAPDGHRRTADAWLEANLQAEEEAEPVTPASIPVLSDGPWQIDGNLVYTLKGGRNDLMLYVTAQPRDPVREQPLALRVQAMLNAEPEPAAPPSTERDSPHVRAPRLRERAP